MPGRGKRRRTVMAADAEWERIRMRARASGLDVSAYIVARLAAPSVGKPAADTAGTLDRVERAVRFLCEVERARLLQDDDPAAFEALVRRAEAGVDRERGLG